MDKSFLSRATLGGLLGMADVLPTKLSETRHASPTQVGV